MADHYFDISLAVPRDKTYVFSVPEDAAHAPPPWNFAFIFFFLVLILRCAFKSFDEWDVGQWCDACSFEKLPDCVGSEHESDVAIDGRY